MGLAAEVAAAVGGGGGGGKGGGSGGSPEREGSGRRLISEGVRKG